MAADREGPGLSSSPEIMRDFFASTSCQCLAICMYALGAGVAEGHVGRHPPPPLAPVRLQVLLDLPQGFPGLLALVEEIAVGLLGGLVGLLHGRHEGVEVYMLADFGGGLLDLHFLLPCSVAE